MANTQPAEEYGYLWVDLDEFDDLGFVDSDARADDEPRDPWYQSTSAIMALAAIGVALIAILVSVILLVSRDYQDSTPDPVKQTITRPSPRPANPPPVSATDQPSASPSATPPPVSATDQPSASPSAPPPSPAASTVEQPSADAPPPVAPTARPPADKPPEINVTRTPVTRSPISVAPQPRRPPQY